MSARSRSSAFPAILVAIVLLCASPALARTDLSGCVSTQVIFEQFAASLIWYVPGTGEICSFIDCGGGRAPPKTTVPGCAGYDGTATVTPSFLSGFPRAAATGTATTAPGATGGFGSGSGPGNSVTFQGTTETHNHGSPTPTLPSSITTPVSAGNSAAGNSAAGNSAAGSLPSSAATGAAAGGDSSKSSTAASRTSTAGAAGPTRAAKEMLGAMAGLAVAGLAMV
ncbi:hypothetical protein B0T26DRAFT_678724 [Lasiosphaeria miniovina]|uniref:Siderophore biosynthesis enzyme n=1 Tax=Lasiosphaeria miniovina TaxID=1954250 RepID=A0AA40DMM2_9PEZI|nr:uncharacterized protein B0T26DRAFT_678724 [Lasiosphaeria miniovina]KAK0709279.1 hypothetical protein B0T26DRAFT_678724 [Lasiosphaeria miniovina]